MYVSRPSMTLKRGSEKSFFSAARLTLCSTFECMKALKSESNVRLSTGGSSGATSGVCVAGSCLRSVCATAPADSRLRREAAAVNAALRAAGAAVMAVDLVMNKKAQTVFCSVRPPGHHACVARPMGFCIFNNVAVAARHAIGAHGLERVAIIDFDVHHGNGTEDIFEGDEQVLMVSTFQHPFYPY